MTAKQRLMIQMQGDADQLNAQCLDVWNNCGKEQGRVAKLVRDQLLATMRSSKASEADKVIAIFAWTKLNETHVRLGEAMDEQNKT